MIRLTIMRFALALALVTGCAASGTTAAPTTPPPPPAAVKPLVFVHRQPAPVVVEIAKSPVVRFEKSWIVAYPTREHGLAPRASVTYADVACVSDAGHTKCAMRGAAATRPDDDLRFQGRLGQCFRVTAATLPAATLRSIESSPTSTPPVGSAATFVSIATDGKDTLLQPVIDCPNGFPPYRQCDSTRPVVVERHTFDAFFGRANERVGDAFAMTWAPAALAIVEGDPRFTNRLSDPRAVLASMESMPLEKESDEVRFANLVDRAVLAFQTADEKKGAAYVKELDAWMAAHPSAPTSPDFVALRATLAALTSGALRTTDPCTAQAARGVLFRSP